MLFSLCSRSSSDPFQIHAFHVDDFSPALQLAVLELQVRLVGPRAQAMRRNPTDNTEGPIKDITGLSPHDPIDPASSALRLCPAGSILQRV